MDKSKVVRILAPYSPPLSLSQVEAIAEEIVSVSIEEKAAEASTPAKKSRRSKSRS